MNIRPSRCSCRLWAAAAILSCSRFFASSFIFATSIWTSCFTHTSLIVFASKRENVRIGACSGHEASLLERDCHLLQQLALRPG